MDRGGFGRHADGTNVAVVFDGVSAGGKRNAYAAQAFARSTLNHLVRHKCAFTGQVTGSTPAGVVRTLPAVELFGAALDPTNNPGDVDPRYEAEGGAATGAIVTFAPGDSEAAKSEVLLVGAALGDAAVIVVEPPVEAGAIPVARQLNQVERIGGCANDSGGQLNMCMGISGIVRAFAQPIHPETLVLVCTDGLTDNLPARDSEAAALLPMLMRCTLLDNPVPGEGLAAAANDEDGSLGIPGAEAVMNALRQAYADATVGVASEPESELEPELEPEPEPELHLGTELEMSRSVYFTPRESQTVAIDTIEDSCPDQQDKSVYFTPRSRGVEDVSVATAVGASSNYNEPRLVGLRLKHYLDWVTRRLYVSEQAYFAEEARYHALLRMRAVAEVARQEKEGDDTPSAGGLMNAETVQRAEQTSVDQQIAASEERLREMVEKQKAGPRLAPGKTDDALMIVMRPHGVAAAQ